MIETGSFQKELLVTLSELMEEVTVVAAEAAKEVVTEPGAEAEKK